MCHCRKTVQSILPLWLMISGVALAQEDLPSATRLASASTTTVTEFEASIPPDEADSFSRKKVSLKIRQPSLPANMLCHFEFVGTTRIHSSPILSPAQNPNGWEVELLETLTEKSVIATFTCFTEDLGGESVRTLNLSYDKNVDGIQLAFKDFTVSDGAILPSEVEIGSEDFVCLEKTAMDSGLEFEESTFGNGSDNSVRILVQDSERPYSESTVCVNIPRLGDVTSERPILKNTWGSSSVKSGGILEILITPLQD